MERFNIEPRMKLWIMVILIFIILSGFREPRVQSVSPEIELLPEGMTVAESCGYDRVWIQGVGFNPVGQAGPR